LPGEAIYPSTLRFIRWQTVFFAWRSNLSIDFAFHPLADCLFCLANQFIHRLCVLSAGRLSFLPVEPGYPSTLRFIHWQTVFFAWRTNLSIDFAFYPLADCLFCLANQFIHRLCVSSAGRLSFLPGEPIYPSTLRFIRWQTVFFAWRTNLSIDFALFTHFFFFCFFFSFLLSLCFFSLCLFRLCLFYIVFSVLIVSCLFIPRLFLSFYLLAKTL
jgi:hypothetical protein